MTIASHVSPSETERVEPFARRRLEPFEPLDIATDRCKGCELCVAICPKHCLALDLTVVNALGYHPVALTDAAACTSCALCARICPDAVFAVYARPKDV